MYVISSFFPHVFPFCAHSSDVPGSLQCQQCSLDFWSNEDHTACIPRVVDFLSFNETMGITLATASVSGAVVTAAVFVIFLCYRQTPLVRASCRSD